jgi:hypothetical protein
LSARERQENREKVSSASEKYIPSEDPELQVAMDTVKLIAEEGMANCKMRPIMKHVNKWRGGDKKKMKKGGGSDVHFEEEWVWEICEEGVDDDKSGTYAGEGEHKHDSAYSFSQMLCALNDTVVSDMLTEVEKERMYSILMDSSTDTGRYCELSFFICFWDGKMHKIVTRPLGMRRIGVEGETAKNAKVMLLELLQEWGLDKKYMMALGTDGASNMTGADNGLVALLRKEEKMEWLVAVHCSCHKLHLAASAATNRTAKEKKKGEDMECVELVTMRKDFNDIAHFFHKSPLRLRQLEKHQRKAQEEEEKERKEKEAEEGVKRKEGVKKLRKPKRMIAPPGTRWAAAAKTARRVLQNRIPLIDSLNACKEKESNVKKRERIEYLLKQLASPEFVVKAAVFTEVNEVVSNCIKELERDDTKYSELRSIIDNCLERLEEINGNEKTWGTVVNAKLKKEEQTDQLKSLCEEWVRFYVERMKEKIAGRFENIPLHDDFNIFNPKRMRYVFSSVYVFVFIWVNRLYSFTVCAPYQCPHRCRRRHRGRGSRCSMRWS